MVPYSASFSREVRGNKSGMEFAAPVSAADAVSGGSPVKPVVDPHLFPVRLPSAVGITVDVAPAAVHRPHSAASCSLLEFARASSFFIFSIIGAFSTNPHGIHCKDGVLSCRTLSPGMKLPCLTSSAAVLRIFLTTVSGG